jgi:phosphoadenosine phosphosulfate reductase
MEKTMKNIDLDRINKELEQKSPGEIIEWALSLASAPVVTTNFRPYEVAILYACTKVKNDLKVIWCDTGYNTPQTYAHANDLIKKLALNVYLYVPKQTAEHRNVTMGIPQIEDPMHQIFTQQVKLEPFNRAMAEHKPDVWFTNLRKGQTAFRDNIGIVSLSKTVF